MFNLKPKWNEFILKFMDKRLYTKVVTSLVATQNEFFLLTAWRYGQLIYCKMPNHETFFYGLKICLLCRKIQIKKNCHLILRQFTFLCPKWPIFYVFLISDQYLHTKIRYEVLNFYNVLPAWDLVTTTKILKIVGALKWLKIAQKNLFS